MDTTVSHPALTPVPALRHSDATTGSRFKPASAALLQHIDRYNADARPNLLFAGVSVSVESAQLGFQLHQILGRHYTHTDRWYSFFGNSFEEAVSGAVKLARHHRAVRGEPWRQRGWLLCVDPDGVLENYFDPVGAGHDLALVPRVCQVRQIEEVDDLDVRGWDAVLVVGDEPASTAGRTMVADLQASGAAYLQAFPNAEPSDPVLGLAGLEPDVVIFGESLAASELAFGCFCMTRAAYKVWNNPDDALAQTSTFGGNGLTLSWVLSLLSDGGHVQPDDAAVHARIAADRGQRNEYFRHHVNPQATNGLEMFGLDLDIESARGQALRLRDGTVLHDCAGGTGASLRGHNPPEVREVVATHQRSQGNLDRLRRMLADLTGFTELVPAVSGTTAVEAAVRLALLARPDRRKIITFRGNYSGKSLGALNLSRYGPQRSASIPDAFAPYYLETVYLDPFDPGTPMELRALARQGEIALVWCELTQGMSCETLPDSLLHALVEEKETGGYLLGIDEVLTGVWRSDADAMLLSTKLLADVDLCSLAKPLSDMTLPFGVTLTTAEVLEAALRTNPRATMEILHSHEHELAADVAVSALSFALEARARRAANERALHEALDKIVASSSVFTRWVGPGLHVRLVPHERWFPFAPKSLMGQLVEASIQDLVMSRCRVMVAQQRFFPPLFADPADLQVALDELVRGLPNIRIAAVYRNIARRLLQGTRVRSRKRRSSRSETTAVQSV